MDDMDILVDENETFPIVVFYRVIRNEMGQKIRVEAVTDEVRQAWDPEKRGEVWDDSQWKRIEAHFIQPSSNRFGEALELATIINHVNFRPLLRTWTFRECVLIFFMKAWDASIRNDAEGRPIILPINSQTMGDLHYEVSQALFMDYMNKTGMAAELKAALKDEQAARLMAREQTNIPPSAFMPPPPMMETPSQEPLPPMPPGFPVIYGAGEFPPR